MDKQCIFMHFVLEQIDNQHLVNKCLSKEEIVIHRERLFRIHYATLLNFCLVIYGFINTQFIINLFNKNRYILNVTSNISSYYIY